MLLVRGYSWIAPGHKWVLLLVALLIGTVKSLLVLDKSVKKSIARIAAFQDGTCLGAVYSWKTWLLVLCMVLFGVSLRMFFHPGTIIGMLYCAIGWALWLSSRYGWLVWIQEIHT